ncbi:MAG: rod shape-determining protein MreC [Gammaproteobacteria bacterium]|nr:rod shape-determining protein MreC [Gammaproteobacteria bacterium]MXX95619.1 rod shape-determining protein MreC [Gammaproteobacteria bacterium]MYF53952.1 rod shape-determining protein MreC [Gammaproteobacteria bacterium]MYK43690.1 rod shape-determining protein MreC [Gammaproteobacteria bacterium]
MLSSRRGANQLPTYLILCIVCCLLFALEIFFTIPQTPRHIITWATSNLASIVNLPSTGVDAVSNYITDREVVLQHLNDLERESVELKVQNQRIQSLEQENNELRSLLEIYSSDDRFDFIVAELRSKIQTHSRDEVYLNQGSTDGVEPGRAVIDVSGIYGQVVEVQPFLSRIVRITDQRIAIPARVQRSGLNVVLSGVGDGRHLAMEYATVTWDVKEDDVIVASGLGGVYPAGYPIGVVTSIRHEETGVEATVIVEPSAQIDRRRWLLILMKETNTETSQE